MAHLELRIFIRAPQQRVWEIISDLARQRDWMVDLRRLEIVTEQTSGAGTTAKVTSALFGLPLVREEMEITAWQPPHRYDVAHRGEFFKGTGAFVLEPAQDGTTFIWIEDFDTPLGPLGELGYKLIVGPHIRSTFRRSMENVKRLAEAPV